LSLFCDATCHPLHGLSSSNSWLFLTCDATQTFWTRVLLIHHKPYKTFNTAVFLDLNKEVGKS
jgi:hypothetical protein